MAVLDVGVIADRPTTRIHLVDLAHRYELVERVVHRCQTYLGETLPRSVKHLLRGEMDVKASHRLGDNPSLRGQAPVPGTKAVEKRC